MSKNNSKIPAVVKDVINPTINMTLVSADQNDKTKINISVSADDNYGISKIKIYVDNFIIPKQTCIEKTCSYTSTYTRGNTYKYSVNATDISGLNNSVGIFEFKVGEEENTANGNCNNNIDDDNDLAVDSLDTGCAGAYVNLTATLPSYSGTSTPALGPWEDTEIDLRCRISLYPSDLNLGRANACIFAMLDQNKNACTLKDTNTDVNVDYTCNVGSLGEKNISCNILNDCNAYLDPLTSQYTRQLNYTIKVTKPSLCRTIVGQDKIEISYAYCQA